jgi:hypothetical protein
LSKAQKGLTEKQIVQLERDPQDAFVRGDIKALDEGTAEDYTTVSAAGVAGTKPQMMANLRANKTIVKSVELSSLRGRIQDRYPLTTIHRHDPSENRKFDGPLSLQGRSQSTFRRSRQPDRDDSDLACQARPRSIRKVFWPCLI